MLDQGTKATDFVIPRISPFIPKYSRFIPIKNNIKTITMELKSYKKGDLCSQKPENARKKQKITLFDILIFLDITLKNPISFF
jgi:hypothetical protein